MSARRQEGGSLPLVMQHSSAVQPPSDQPFMSEYKNKKSKEKQHMVIDLGDNADEKKQRYFDPGCSKDVSY